MVFSNTISSISSWNIVHKGGSKFIPNQNVRGSVTFHQTLNTRNVIIKIVTSIHPKTLIYNEIIFYGYYIPINN